MKNIKAFLFANIPLSVVHFILFLVAGSQGWSIRGILGQPGFWLTGLLGAASGGLIWWVLMVLNSLVWGAVISLFVIPLLRKLLK